MPAAIPDPGTGRHPRPAEDTAVDRARRHVDDLLTHFRTGAWRPTLLETRIAALLLTATAGDGMLTAHRVRAALWEGGLPLTHAAGGGRFAQLLGDLVPVLDDPWLAALDIVDAAGELVGAVASTTAPAHRAA
ncbi:hypothetical protein [Streptomyces sp. ODS05-4]|uniref:hypothetical protein n=1 Tax=Streptomyces sp. ODS05-4 TaxID=2944939 RepID=UPI00210A22E0|nr:hypothetical protein [Streptomyces sp. ODS05-4]